MTVGGSKDKRTPLDKIWDTIKGCCIGCCKCPVEEEPEPISEGGTPASKQIKKKHLFEANQLEKASGDLQDDSGVFSMVFDGGSFCYRNRHCIVMKTLPRNAFD